MLKRKSEISLEVLDHSQDEAYGFVASQFGVWFKICNQSENSIVISELGLVIGEDKKNLRIQNPFFSDNRMSFPQEIEKHKTLTAYFQLEFDKAPYIHKAYAKSGSGEYFYYSGDVINRLNDF